MRYLIIFTNGKRVCVDAHNREDAIKVARKEYTDRIVLRVTIY
jgi:TATA-box binding protein (TBP) (component of TFIID and TFIIIB)